MIFSFVCLSCQPQHTTEVPRQRDVGRLAQPRPVPVPSPQALSHATTLPAPSMSPYVYFCLISYQFYSYNGVAVRFQLLTPTQEPQWGQGGDSPGTVSSSLKHSTWHFSPREERKKEKHRGIFFPCVRAPAPVTTSSVTPSA